MNEGEIQVDGNQWAVDDSDIEYDSEGSISVSDDTEGEVPETTGAGNDANPSHNLIVGAGKPLLKAPVWTSAPPTIGTPNNKEGSFSRGWKPVIDGKIQTVSEVAALKVRTTPMQATSAKPSGTKLVSTEIGSPSLAVTGATEPKKDGNESDSEVRRVPDMSSKGSVSGATAAQPQGQSSAPRSRKRGGAPADKEHKRLKRLLRNRVSAQQARERKKAYLSDLEVRSKELQKRNEELEERVSTLERENYMLRQIVKTTSLKKV